MELGADHAELDLGSTSSHHSQVGRQPSRSHLAAGNVTSAQQFAFNVVGLIKSSNP
jgi:hypothetical protein